MIKVFKWWWAWDYQRVEDWLEKMESNGLKLVNTKLLGIIFCFERCSSTKGRYCIDFQTKLTSEYMEIINDDGWQLYQLGLGWYILRKEYQDQRPDFYNDFEGLIKRNRTLLTVISILLVIELLAIGNMVWDTYRFYNVNKLASTCIMSSLAISLFAFIIANLATQINKFSKKTK